MKTSLSAAIAALALLALPAAAHARIVQLGTTTDTTPPNCPNQCVAISRTTGYQLKIGPHRNLFTVPADGKLVAWSITLAKPGKTQQGYFEKQFGQASAGISVLRTGSHLAGRVVAQSPVLPLTSYFGQTADFALDRAIVVHKGELVALTVPTWAPALAVLPDRRDVAWRASRATACREPKTTTSQTSQTRVGQLAHYRCLYQMARLTYGATVVTNPGRG